MMFQLKEHNTNVKTELLAGVTTFMTMAYILVVNPNLLSQVGGDMTFNAVFLATAIAAAIGSAAMGLLANYPYALAPGMGLNAFFVYTVVLGGRLTMEQALTAVLIEGVLFLILTFVNVREAIFNAIPTTLKYAVSAGIGLFIAFIGFQDAGIIVNSDGTLVTISNQMTSAPIVLAIIGVIVIAVLAHRQVRGSILIGILITWGLGIVAQLTGWYGPEMNSVIPSGIVAPIHFGDMLWFRFDFSGIGNLDFWIVMFSFLFVDLFDTLGTLIGVSSKAGLLDQDGKLPRAKQALFADAIATTLGACMGTSTTTTYVESAAGVADGGRTGLTAIMTAGLFLLALPFAPLFSAIPTFATAPALIYVGFLMLESVTKINFSDITKGLPAFLTILVMPISYSISEGIAFGVITYTILNVLGGKKKDVHPLMYFLTIAFILKFVFVK